MSIALRLAVIEREANARRSDVADGIDNLAARHQHFSTVKTESKALHAALIGTR